MFLYKSAQSIEKYDVIAFMSVKSAQVHENKDTGFRTIENKRSFAFAVFGPGKKKSLLDGGLGRNLYRDIIHPGSSEKWEAHELKAAPLDSKGCANHLKKKR